MRPVTVSVTGPGVTPPVPLDQYLTPFEVSLAAINPSGATYTVEWTQDNIWDPNFNPATANWTNGPANMVGAVDTEYGTLISPVAAVRLRQTVGAGTTQLIVRQAGAGAS